MSEHQRFAYRSLAELGAEIARLGVGIPLQEGVGILAEPVTVGRFRLPNRFAVHPMEGFDSDTKGAPGPLSFRRYRRYAEGGAGLLWFEATAVLWEARSNPGQLWLHEGSVDAFARLVAETRRTAREAWGREPVLVLQLTHSGRYSKPAGVPRPLIAHHSPILDPLHRLPADYPLLTDDDLDRLQDHFVAAARLAARAGFDGVDIKGCHRYLAAELHASFTRSGRYGGSFENRTRLLRETMTRIREEVPGVFVTTRLNAYDAIAYPYGFGVSTYDYRVPDLSEPLRYVGLLKGMGIPLLNLSIGNPYYNPHYGRPYDFQVYGANLPEEHPLQGIARFLAITRTVQMAYPDLPVIGSGYAWLRHFMPNVAAAVVQSGGATLVGQGRGAFAYPDSVRDILAKGAMDPGKCCVTCSGCTQIMRDGAKTGCVLHDAEVYGPQYRLGRRYAMDRLQHEVRRCRACLEATCAAACPAHIDIPNFLKAFARGDIAAAYSTLRERNVLPEMCGFVCPANEQCQGHCVEDIFVKNPVPIQDIQVVVARSARLQGLTGVKLGAATGKRVTVVGGGPAGLACAIRLLERGHNLTLIERSARLGGTPQTSIPEERYADADAEVEAILAPALAAGRLEVRLHTALGRDTTLDAVRQATDAVFLGVGLTATARLGDANGVTDALTFLRDAKRGALPPLPARVAVLGAGNTAMDAASTALGLGARDVTLIYRRSFREMPAWKAERDAFLAKGGNILLLHQPVGYEQDAGGQVRGVRLVRTELGEPDASGRRRPVPLPGTASVFACDLVIEAMGQALDEDLRQALAGIEITPGGLIAVDAHFATSLPAVFAAGDAVNGGTTAVQGIAEALRTAEAIHEDLMARQG
jgi:NADPH-dependent glutamate synthase beta subunit-like oxidoreductase/2,4-dienoyl-CoA reductase-like NADH-dependent reductase (Old Yellow Enzyme family)